MRLKKHYLSYISVCYVIFQSISAFSISEDKQDKFFQYFRSNSQSEEDGSINKMFEDIPIYERNKVLIKIGNLESINYRTQKCKSACSRYYLMFLDSYDWVNNTPFSNENKALIKLLMKVHANAAMSFDELYDLPIGVQLAGEKKTLILHSMSKENDPYMNVEWSAKFGRKIWIVDREIEPGENEINGEKVYIFDTRVEDIEKNIVLRELDILAKNIFPIRDSLIKRDRCSDLRERFEYTFLSWNSRSMKEHLSSTSAFADPCYNSSIEGWNRDGHVILPEKCSSNEKFLSLLSNMTNVLSPCQLEYEYTTGKVWSFFLRDDGLPWNHFGLWPYYSNAELMKMDPSGEVVNALDGFRILSYLTPETERTKEMWEEVRKIGVWEKVRVKATELFLDKRLKLRKYLFEGGPTKLDGIAKELMERIEKDKLEKEKLLHKKKTPHK